MPSTRRRLCQRLASTVAPIALIALIGLAATTSAQAASVVPSGPSTQQVTRHATDQLTELGDAYLVEQDGSWFCPHTNEQSTALCPQELGQGGSSQHFAEVLIKSIVHDRELGAPDYLRVGKARNDCALPPSLAAGEEMECTTGVPAEPPRAQGSGQPKCTNPHVPAAGFEVDSPYCALKDLKDLGVHLGVIVGAAQNHPSGTKPQPRSVKEISYHACEINHDDTANLYDFMFLDQAPKLSDEALKDVVDKVQGGIYWNPDVGAYVPCPYGGWPHLITNDTDYPKGTLATGAWAHAKRFSVMDKPDWQVDAPAAARGDRPAIEEIDHAFIRDVYEQDPGSHPILRLEVAAQSARFAQLAPGVQCQLLTRWAEEQQSSPDLLQHYGMIFPLYGHTLPRSPYTYDSLYRGTFQHQRELVHAFNPDTGFAAFSSCPQPAR